MTIIKLIIIKTHLATCVTAGGCTDESAMNLCESMVSGSRIHLLRAVTVVEKKMRSIGINSQISRERDRERDIETRANAKTQKVAELSWWVPLGYP